MARRFGYYEHLSVAERATYRKSDGVPRILLPDAAALAQLARTIDEALAGGKRARVARSSNALGQALCAQLGVAPVAIRVRETRPALGGGGGELHGLYTFADDDAGTPPKIEVWMRTHAKGRVVRFRTFLRTLLHELVHHLDVVFLGLDDSFHTEGFLRRESSLMRQIAGSIPQRARPAPPPAREDAARRTIPFSFASGTAGGVAIERSAPLDGRVRVAQPAGDAHPRQLSLFA